MMPRMRLVRVGQSHDKIWGVLVGIGGEPVCVTLERGYEPKKADSSAVPIGLSPLIPKFGAGVYDCHKEFFNRGKYYTFEIVVPNHKDILFHIGNSVQDTDGCVLVGTYYAAAGVADSAKAFNKLMQRYGHLQAFTLEVR